MRFVFALSVIFVLAAGCGTTEAVPDPEPQPAASNTPNNPFQTVVVTGRVVNLREGPGTRYAVVGSVRAGDSLLVTGGVEDWYRIYVPEKSLFAWIYSSLTTGTQLPQ